METLKEIHDDFKTQTQTVIDKLERRATNLETSLFQVRRQVDALKKAITAASGNGTTVKVKKKQKPWGELTLSPQRRRLLHGFLMNNDNEITSASVKSSFPGWSGSAVNIGMAEFRREGLLQLERVGRRNQNVYRSMLTSYVAASENAVGAIT